VNPLASGATSWQNFYLLLGTAATTLLGLMFVAVTFGSSRVDREERPEILLGRFERRARDVSP
jgi:hypothetical protein